MRSAQEESAISTRSRRWSSASNGGDGLAAASEEPVEVFSRNTLKIFAAMLAVAQNHRARLHCSVLSTFLNTARFCRYVNLRFTSLHRPSGRNSSKQTGQSSIMILLDSGGEWRVDWIALR